MSGTGDNHGSYHGRTRADCNQRSSGIGDEHEFMTPSFIEENRKNVSNLKCFEKNLFFELLRSKVDGIKPTLKNEARFKTT